jgi:hypothetical protein
VRTVRLSKFEGIGESRLKNHDVLRIGSGGCLTCAGSWDRPDSKSLADAWHAQ